MVFKNMLTVVGLQKTKPISLKLDKVYFSYSLTFEMWSQLMKSERDTSNWNLRNTCLFDEWF